MVRYSIDILLFGGRGPAVFSVVFRFRCPQARGDIVPTVIEPQTLPSASTALEDRFITLGSRPWWPRRRPDLARPCTFALPLGLPSQPGTPGKGTPPGFRGLPRGGSWTFSAAPLPNPAPTSMVASWPPGRPSTPLPSTFIPRAGGDLFRLAGEWMIGATFQQGRGFSPKN